MSVSPYKAINPIDLLTAFYYLGRKTPVTLLYCLDEYPVEYPILAQETVALGMEVLTIYATAGVGWSSHVAYPAAVNVALAAAEAGAEMIEVHLRVRGITPDGAPDNGDWSLWEDELAELVEVVRGATV